MKQKTAPWALWMNVLLAILLAACIARLWFMTLPSSFWVDEMATAFVAHRGAHDPSLAVAPQVAESIYYWLPRASEALFGFSEISYRLPSILAMGLGLFFIARLAARLIHPGAAWFAPFACLALTGISYQAADARPYALGTCAAAAGLFFLVRWFDRGRWFDGAAFVVFASLLLRVHLIFWPFYLVFAMYAVFRLAAGDSRIGWRRVAAAFALTGLCLAPALFDALTLLHQAKSHVVTDLPTLRDLRASLKLGLVLRCGVGAWLLGYLFRWRLNKGSYAPAAIALVLTWWLSQPLCLFAFSYLTGNSTFVSRYLFLELPGAALATTLAVAYFIPVRAWKPLSAALAIGVIAVLGQWDTLWPPHHNSDWRGAANRIDALTLSADTPVICTSPFIEAKPPVWQPNYALPGFLYSHLAVYRLTGKPYLFPFEPSAEATQFARTLAHQTLSKSKRFFLYGSDHSIMVWRDWFSALPELANWNCPRLSRFGDVSVVEFEPPSNSGPPAGQMAIIRLAP